MARIETQIPRRKKPAQRMELESEWEMDHGTRETHLKMTPDRMQPKGGVSKQHDDSPAQQSKRSSTTI
ncbi:MAG: hypothetical protein ABW047_00130 [Nitrospiraceae bacterium]